ncbi:MAG: hypothetical protein GY867_00240 [bacterium]|nr:hypothetical protein [bacterium]
MRNKSIKKIHVRLLAVVCTAICIVGSDSRSADPDPIIEYYWNNVAGKARLISPAQTGISYVLTARTFCHRIARGGRVASTDTVTCEYFYTGDCLDSLRVGEGEKDCAERVDLTFPYIFDNAYDLSLFPNDTGGVALAIGLISDSAATGQPDGLLVIDRNEYVLRNLYLYYPEKEGYRRFTRSFRFTEHEGYLFPDSVWEVGNKLGIFSSDNYRTESGVTEIRILR